MSIQASSLARWPARCLKGACYCAAVASVLLVLAGPAYRLHLLPLMPALLGAAAGFVLFVAAFALGALSTQFWRGRSRTLPRFGWPMIVVAGILTIATAYWIVRLRASPPIHDLSTDLQNPPAFKDIATIRAASGAMNSATYTEWQVIGAQRLNVPTAQRRAYPDLKSVDLASSRERAFQLAEQAARSMHWTLVTVVPNEGRIEATDTTLYFGFKDDVVIRVIPFGQGSRIDVRSESRLGLGDAGANANRIRAYLARLQGLIVAGERTAP